MRTTQQATRRSGPGRGARERRAGGAGRGWGTIVATVLLGLSLLGSALPAGRVMAAVPADRVARSSALPAGLTPVLRRALGLRAVAVGSRQGLSEPDATWSQQAKLTASDAASGDWFGVRVALSGNTALVGAWFKNSHAGAAYVFVRSGSTWSQQAALADPAPAVAGDQFGNSVALSGTTALVTAPGKNSGTGVAYVFVRSGASWSQQAALTAGDGVPGDALGNSHAALSGNTALVGAPGKNSGTGAAYVFVRSGTSWSQQATLTASDGAANDQFGQAVGLSGNTALVGAYGKTIGTNSSQGAAYVFVRSGGTWSQQQELTASDGAAQDFFGLSVAISNGTALVGANRHNSTGAVYVFVRSGTTWSRQATLTASDAASGGGFGGDVALSGKTALVGAPGMNAAYVFVRSRTTWSQQAKLTASDGVSGDNVGWSVALSGNTALVGAPNKNINTGASYVFVRG